MANRNDLNQLAQQLRSAAKAYYDSAELEMTDADYDAGIETLRAATHTDPTLKDHYADLLEDVAAGQSAGGDVNHPTLMGSMNKVPTLQAVKDFVTKVTGPVVVEPKLDGLAVRATYVNDHLTLVATRGDGRTGEDITTQARHLNLLKDTITDTALAGRDVELRGEVYMPTEAFPKANKVRTDAGSTAFVNPRNAAAGILRKGDPAYAGMLAFAAYSVTGLDEGVEHREAMATAEEAGATTSLSLMSAAGFSTEVTEDIDVVLERIDQLGQSRETLGYPIDGAVVKAVRSVDRDRLGEGSAAPNWSVAYKYAAEETTTTVTAITTDVGRTGRLSITIEVEPVFVGDATVSRASGHNVQWMQERDIRVQDTVVIRRANDVIPYVSEVVLEKRPEDTEAWQPPATDPLGRPWDKSTALWRSTSPELAVLPTLEYAMSRDALDVEGIGTEVATALIDTGLVSDLADVFTVTKDQWAQLTLTSGRKLGEKTAVKIMQELEEAKQASWNRVITALGVRATGRTMGRRLAAAFPTMDALRAATVDDLAQVDGIATKKAEIIHEGLQTLAATGLLDRLADAGVNMGAEPDTTDQAPAPLDGESVVVTGKVGKLTRTEVQERIETLGGKAASSVSSTTTLLVADPSSTSSKVKKAKSLNIRMMSPEQFLAL